MKVLVTGKHGQLARSLVERSRNRDDLEMVTVGRPEADLEIPGAVARAIQTAAPDVVINAAAYTAVDLAEDEPDKAFRINRDAAGEAAAAARSAGARFIHVSTDYVFDGRGSEPYAEDAPTNPLGVYGRSKLGGEEQVRQEAHDHLILRTAWVYSPFGRNFLKTMMTLARDRDSLSVVDDQWGNPTSAEDLAEGLLHIVEHWSEGRRTGLGETYHLAGTGDTNWHEFAAFILAQCATLGLRSARALPIPSEAFPTKAERPRNSRLNSGRFARDFEFIMPDWRLSARRVIERLADRGES
jgi:dTDP-4-dehydrorhamnose reductase